MQWHSQEWAWTGTCPSSYYMTCLSVCSVIKIDKDGYSLIKQSNVLLKKSEVSLCPCWTEATGPVCQVLA